MKTIVVGLGNPILGDDGVGWLVADEVKKQLAPELSIDIDCLSLGGISLMERLIGYQCAIIIDAYLSEEEQGSIRTWKLEDLPNHAALHLTSVHDMSLQNAIKLGKQLGAELPEEIIIVGILARHVFDFSDELSPPILSAIPKATQIVVELLMQKITIH